ncbi:hypothetical protein BRD13_07650 [Halobacteriales archaeon SW_5_70_135]|nr:MAG: hypothetical protein BRD13_07650 [Halobacteriales archaeon SW_5_70_135]
MPEIDLSPEQYAYVEALRDELAEEVTYGTVRLADAVQYLVDHHREDGDLDVEVDDLDVDDAAADGGQAVAADDEREPTGDGGDGGDPLDSDNETVSEMLSLLEDHDDVWSEVEEGYAVELPDGGTEQARTKDDVRALLFQHYR